MITATIVALESHMLTFGARITLPTHTPTIARRIVTLTKAFAGTEVKVSATCHLATVWAPIPRFADTRSQGVITIRQTIYTAV